MGPEAEEDSSPLPSSSESLDEGSSVSSDAGEPMDYDQMRDMITRAYQVVDEEDQGAGSSKAPGNALVSSAWRGAHPRAATMPCGASSVALRRPCTPWLSPGHSS